MLAPLQLLMAPLLPLLVSPDQIWRPSSYLMAPLLSLTASSHTSAGAPPATDGALQILMAPLLPLTASPHTGVMPASLQLPMGPLQLLMAPLLPLTASSYTRAGATPAMNQIWHPSSS